MTDKMTPHSSLRPDLPALEAFLNKISDEAPSGPSLRYELIYDDIRLYRQEDDPRLSMGIWETELKQADWSKVESLCIEALLTKTKDLQISMWLTEAWTCLDGLIGYTRGIKLLSALTQSFWETIHPQPVNDDMENRVLIFEWMDSALSDRLLLIPLTRSTFDETSYGLAYYKSAQHSDAIQRRVDKPKGKNQKIDPSKAMGTVEEFQRSLTKTPHDILSNIQETAELALQVTQEYKESLNPLLDKAAPSFSKILTTISEIQRIVKANLQTRKPAESAVPQAPASPAEKPTPIEPVAEAPVEPVAEVPVEPVAEVPVEPVAEVPAEPVAEAAPEPTPPSPKPSVSSIETRTDAYRQLEKIANFLEQKDPHSLAPQLLRQVIQWENKNVMDIFSEIAKTPQEYEILMKILGSKPKGKE